MLRVKTLGTISVFRQFSKQFIEQVNAAKIAKCKAYLIGYDTFELPNFNSLGHINFTQRQQSFNKYAIIL